MHVGMANRLNPQDVSDLLGMGQSLLGMKEYAKARDELEKAIQIHPDDAQLHFQLVQAYSRLGDRQKADASLQAFRELHAKETVEQDLEERKRSFAPAPAASTPLK